MSRLNIIFLILISVMMLALIWRQYFSGWGDREWHRCKESLFTQVIFNECTLIYNGEQEPA